jgi:hypothetical protein
MFKSLPLLAIFTALATGCWAQSMDDGAQQSGSKPDKQPASTDINSKEVEHQPLHLTPLKTIPTSQATTGFGEISCDGDGNFYLGADSPAFPGITKINSNGELAALFKPDLNPDVPVEFGEDFFVTKDGEVYMWVGAKKSFERYVLIFKSDGSYKSNVKLQTGFPWMPANISVFPHGEILMTGQEYVKGSNRTMLPFTAIFSSDGKMLKELELDDDAKINDMAASHDAHIVSSTNPSNNRAVAWGRAAAASDGNIYVMRWLSPAVFYAISPGGEVVHRFTVDPGSSGYMPVQMHISGNRIAVLFAHSSTQDKIMKIVDLEGQDIASYDELRADGKAKLGPLGLAFVCYTARPERFTFITTDNNHKIQFKEVEAR